jgi:sirohydrochlorin ferrochelatase
MTEKKLNKNKNFFSIFSMISILILLLTIPSVSADDEKIGIVVIAHGSPSEAWCNPIRDAVAETELPYQVELGFLELVPNETINNAVDKLDDAGVTKIIAVPLFISSYSGHILEIEYVLGLRDTLPLANEIAIVDGVMMKRSIIQSNNSYVVSYKNPNTAGIMKTQSEEEEEEELIPVDTNARIILTSAMDDHWLIADIVADRTEDLVVDPSNETLVLVAHGTQEEENIDGWVNCTSSLANQAKLKLKQWNDPLIALDGTGISFIHHNDTLHPQYNLTTTVENANGPIVVPLMVSEGYFTGRKIPGLLENLTYAYDKKALTPHPNVAKWIEMRASQEFTDLTVGIYDNSELLDISIYDVEKAHGDICLCVAIAFKATQTAFSEWDGTPVRGDIEIITGHPSDGHTETFEYILNSIDDVTVDLPMGTDIVNLSLDNYNYQFIDKSSGDKVVVSVKENIFPEGFFDLRIKCKQKTATPDEKSAFKLMKNELKDTCLYQPADEVFDVESNGGSNITPPDSGSETELTVEIIPAISMTVPTTSVDFGKVGAGMTSGNQIITVINTGAGSANFSAILQEDDGGFYSKSLKLNGQDISDFCVIVPADVSDFVYEYNVVANLVVPDGSGGIYGGTIFFIAENES